MILPFFLLYHFSSQIIYPTWYVHTPNKETLIKINKDLHRYAKLHGVVNNPKINFGYDYEKVSFESNNFTLKGWVIKNPNPNPQNVGTHSHT
jgi:hypothetical protein